MRFRVSALVLILAAIVWFMAFQDRSVAAVTQRVAGLFDDRPSRSILIVGNSRTFYNDMPAMLRQLSSSANSPIKLQVETSTAPGASFEDHWSKLRTRRLLAAGWDEVILQGESGAQASMEQNESFQIYGAKLAQLAKVTEGRPTLLINWPYDRSVFADYEAYDRSEHLAFLREINSRLATDARLERINLAGLWESVRMADPSIKLTTDGNHPTMAGSYLYALAIYVHATGESVGSLAYVPDGVDPEVAEIIRREVDAFPVSIR